MNNVTTWLYLIGLPERARKLRLRVDGLVSPPVDEMFGREPIQCPTTVLFGAEVSRRLYANPSTRPALDAWDTGMVSKTDIRRWCMEIEKGKYKGEVFYPTVFSSCEPLLKILSEVSKAYVGAVPELFFDIKPVTSDAS